MHWAYLLKQTDLTLSLSRAVFATHQQQQGEEHHNRFLSCTFSALRTNCTNNIKPLIFCLPDCSGAGACFCPYMGCRALPAKACFILKPYLYKRNASFGYLVADATYTIVRRSHLTTCLIPLSGYLTHGRKPPCF